MSKVNPPQQETKQDMVQDPRDITVRLQELHDLIIPKESPQRTVVSDAIAEIHKLRSPIRQIPQPGEIWSTTGLGETIKFRILQISSFRCAQLADALTVVVFSVNERQSRPVLLNIMEIGDFTDGRFVCVPQPAAVREVP